MRKRRAKSKKNHKEPEVIWTKFEIIKCTIYGFIIIISILLFGNRELFLHNVTKLLFKLNIVEKVYVPKKQLINRFQNDLTVITVLRL
jgi:hypothetical protein